MPPTPPCARSRFLARRQNRMSDVPTCLAPMDVAGQTRATAARSARRIGLRIRRGPLARFPAPERRPTTPLPTVRTLTPHADVREAGRGHWPLLRLLAGRTVVCAGGVEVACTESLDTAPASVPRLRAGEEVGLRPYQRRTECEPEPDRSLNAAEPETAQLAPSPLAVRALQRPRGVLRAGPAHEADARCPASAGGGDPRLLGGPLPCLASARFPDAPPPGG